MQSLWYGTLFREIVVGWSVQLKVERHSQPQRVAGQSTYFVIFLSSEIWDVFFCVVFKSFFSLFQTWVVIFLYFFVSDLRCHLLVIFVSFVIILCWGVRFGLSFFLVQIWVVILFSEMCYVCVFGSVLNVRTYIVVTLCHSFVLFWNGLSRWISFVISYRKQVLTGLLLACVESNHVFLTTPPLERLVWLLDIASHFVYMNVRSCASIACGFEQLKLNRQRSVTIMFQLFWEHTGMRSMVCTQIIEIIK